MHVVHNKFSKSWREALTGGNLKVTTWRSRLRAMAWTTTWRSRTDGRRRAGDCTRPSQRSGGPWRPPSNPSRRARPKPTAAGSAGAALSLRALPRRAALGRGRHRSSPICPASSSCVAASLPSLRQLRPAGIKGTTARVDPSPPPSSTWSRPRSACRMTRASLRLRATPRHCATARNRRQCRRRRIRKGRREESPLGRRWRQ